MESHFPHPQQLQIQQETHQSIPGTLLLCHTGQFGCLYMVRPITALSFPQTMALVRPAAVKMMKMSLFVRYVFPTYTHLSVHPYTQKYHLGLDRLVGPPDQFVPTHFISTALCSGQNGRIVAHCAKRSSGLWRALQRAVNKLVTDHLHE